MATLVTEDLIVAEGEVRTYADGLAFNWVQNHQPSLINRGEMRFQIFSDGTFINFAGGSDWNEARIENYGTISAALPNVNYLKVLYSSSRSPDLYNAGSIIAEARAQAIVYETWDPTIAITNTVTGSIRATSQGNAFALYLAEGGTVTNAGSIVATSTNGGAAVALSFHSGEASVVNSGLLQARDNSFDPYAIAIDLHVSSGETHNIVNTGTISADYAIREFADAPTSSRTTVDNSGFIQGRISLAHGSDFVRNSGRIEGDVELGADHDIYDGRQGTVVGTVFGGDGNDLLIGGGALQTLNGGSGADVLVSGGGDILIGGGGATTYVYKTVTPGAPDEQIGGFASGFDHIDLRALSPSSVTISGSTVTAVTASGTLMIHVGGPVTMADILVDPTAVMSGTDWGDALVAGDVGSVLMGGNGADLLLGGAGNDRLEGGAGGGFAEGEPGNAMLGGAGDDTYVVSYFRDFIVEDPNAGYDTIEIVPGAFPLNMSFQLPDNVERLIGWSGIGNSLDNVMVGSSGADQISGRGGADTIDGGAGNDDLGGGEGVDLLTGGAGEDQFIGTLAELNGDTITDLSAGDRIVITDANIANFNFALNGTTLTFTGGSLTLSNAPIRPIFARPAFFGGVEVFLLPLDPQNDFNGDGRSDILWRNDDGTIGDWLATNHGFAVNNASLTSQSTGQTLAGTGDFTGEGRDEILWRGSDGSVTIWFSNPSGAFPAIPEDNGAAVPPPTRIEVARIPLNWQIAGVGDFNGDGGDDILWRSDSGEVGNWLSRGLGNFTVNPTLVSVPNEWHIIGTGDFNGDLRDDILWRSDAGQLGTWLGQTNGNFAINPNLVGVPAEWHVVGTGDFNGDGFDDILWRSDSGQVGDWLGQADGNFIVNSTLVNVSSDWQVAAVGDYDGDGRDDILWRSDGGQVGNWFGRTDGNFTINPTLVGVSNDWHVQPSTDYLV